MSSSVEESANKNFSFAASEQPQEGIYRWIGLADCGDAISAFQKKDYWSALKCSAVALLKFSLIGASAFGMYKLVAGEAVYLNDFMKQAETDFSTGPAH